MDDIKDIQVRNFSKFLDTEVHTNPFGENRSGERAYRRAERLVAAIFLLTNHIGSDESIRNDVRAAAIVLLQNVLALRDEMRTSGSTKAVEFQATIRRMISQVRMLVFAGFVSAQNAEAVTGALDELGNFLSLSQRTDLSESIRISKDELLDVREFHKGHIKDIKDIHGVKDKRPIKDREETLPSSSTVADGTTAITSRGNRVLDVLRTGGELSIRDIAAQLPEYGGKTVQRELVALIARGSVRRIGLKRWSRYAIAI